MICPDDSSVRDMFYLLSLGTTISEPQSWTSAICHSFWVPKSQSITQPIGSMYAIYGNIWGILMGSMLPYMADMDPMGNAALAWYNFILMFMRYPPLCGWSHTQYPMFCWFLWLCLTLLKLSVFFRFVPTSPCGGFHSHESTQHGWFIMVYIWGTPWLATPPCLKYVPFFGAGSTNPVSTRRST